MNLNPKQLFRLLALSVVACFTIALVGCGDDDAQYIGNDTSSSSDNKNANTVTSERAVRRLEFPALKKTGNQKLIVHRLSNTSYDSDAINFATEWDWDKKSQRWSCYQLHKGFTGNYSRVTNFTFDPALSSGEYWSEFRYFPGYDRGHICPSADRTFSHEANAQTFYMSNMQPQYHEFNGYQDGTSNRGLWVRMEGQESLLYGHHLRVQGRNHRRREEHHHPHQRQDDRAEIFLHGHTSQESVRLCRRRILERPDQGMAHRRDSSLSLHVHREAGTAHRHRLLLQPSRRHREAGGDDI